MTPVAGLDWAALGPNFTLLCAGDDGGFGAVGADLGIPLSVLSLPDAAMRALGARNVLVRPDAFVAWAGEGGDAKKILLRAVGRE
ncbi:MAG: hypothetical protein AAFN59_00270 [Pseudomonadota bacterium]